MGCDSLILFSVEMKITIRVFDEHNKEVKLSKKDEKKRREAEKTIRKVLVSD